MQCQLSETQAISCRVIVRLSVVSCEFAQALFCYHTATYYSVTTSDDLRMSGTTFFRISCCAGTVVSYGVTQLIRLHLLGLVALEKYDQIGLTEKVQV